MRTEPARRSSAAGLGKTSTTSVRRLISLVTRSSGLVAVPSEVVDFPCRYAVQIRLHHDGEQRLIDAAAPLQQGWEEQSCAQLRNSQPQVPRVSSQRPGPRAIAPGASLRRALEGGSADERGRFRIDQLLVERLGRGPYPVGNIGKFQLSKKFEQGNLVKSHRGLCPS